MPEDHLSIWIGAFFAMSIPPYICYCDLRRIGVMGCLSGVVLVRIAMHRTVISFYSDLFSVHAKMR